MDRFDFSLSPNSILTVSVVKIIEKWGNIFPKFYDETFNAKVGTLINYDTFAIGFVGVVWTVESAIAPFRHCHTPIVTAVELPWSAGRTRGGCSRS